MDFFELPVRNGGIPPNRVHGIIAEISIPAVDLSVHLSILYIL